MRPSNPQVLYKVLQFIRGMPIAVPDGRPGDFPKHFRDTRTRHPKVASIAQCTMGCHCGSPVVPGPGRTYARAQPFSTPLAPILFQSGIQTFSSITCKSTKPSNTCTVIETCICRDYMLYACITRKTVKEFGAFRGTCTDKMCLSMTFTPSSWYM